MEGFKRVRSWRQTSQNMSRSLSRSRSKTNWGIDNVFADARQLSGVSSIDDDEEALKWAAIERLPTYDWLRMSMFQTFVEKDEQNREQKLVVDVRKMDLNDRQQFIDRIFKVAEEDNERFLRKLRNRIDNNADEHEQKNGQPHEHHQPLI